VKLKFKAILRVALAGANSVHGAKRNLIWIAKQLSESAPRLQCLVCSLIFTWSMPGKETDNVAHRYLPAAFGAFDVRSRATLQAMTRSEASFGAQWSFREARS
jgi:hypothetical protein